MEEESREKTRELYWNLVAQGDENDAVRIAGEYLNRPGELSEKVDAFIRDWNAKRSETLSNKIRLAQAIAFMGGRRLSDVQTYDAIQRIIVSLEEKEVVKKSSTNLSYVKTGAKIGTTILSKIGVIGAPLAIGLKVGMALVPERVVTTQKSKGLVRNILDMQTIGMAAKKYFITRKQTGTKTSEMDLTEEEEKMSFFRGCAWKLESQLENRNKFYFAHHFGKDAEKIQKVGADYADFVGDARIIVVYEAPRKQGTDIAWTEQGLLCMVEENRKIEIPYENLQGVHAEGQDVHIQYDRMEMKIKADSASSAANVETITQFMKQYVLGDWEMKYRVIHDWRKGMPVEWCYYEGIPRAQALAKAYQDMDSSTLMQADDMIRDCMEAIPSVDYKEELERRIILAQVIALLGHQNLDDVDVQDAIIKKARGKSSLEQIGDFAKQAFLPEETKTKTKDETKENHVKKRTSTCICSNCGAVLPKGAKFCIACGKPVSRPRPANCPMCGAKLPDGAKFCIECGTKVGA